MKTKDVRRTHQAIIRQRLYGGTKRHREKPYKYDVGALVRVSKQRLVFDKGYTPNWSAEIFIVRERRRQRERVA